MNILGPVCLVLFVVGPAAVSSCRPAEAIPPVEAELNSPVDPEPRLPRESSTFLESFLENAFVSSLSRPTGRRVHRHCPNSQPLPMCDPAAQLLFGLCLWTSYLYWRVSSQKRGEVINWQKNGFRWFRKGCPLRRWEFVDGRYSRGYQLHRKGTGIGKDLSSFFRLLESGPETKIAHSQHNGSALWGLLPILRPKVRDFQLRYWNSVNHS